ncbi:MAG: methylmalonyl Co-A mutase-associated GTPase MeaB [Chitinophagales bacterium]|nr:methylmalonyl Co-A mutase-associated GTPase MeaB [Chitinophagales bacterium]
MQKVKSLSSSLLSGDRIALAKAITLIESSSSKHQKEAQQILDEILPQTGNSIRIGITGVPGVGKSTFIEALGNYLIKEKNKKIAVLAIDPTSTVSKGSILGDKTRMENLARNENAFIRPSPSTGTLGGVASQTREAILLCEAAGYDIIFIETVGVGQSETAVHSMIDFMLLLLLPGAGDELQGMKRGIVELADLLAINKADGDNLPKVKMAKADYKQALHLFPASENGWKPDVVACSSLTGSGIPEIWKQIEAFEKLTKANSFFAKRRREQRKYWLKELLTTFILRNFYKNKKVMKKFSEMEKMVEEEKISVTKAAHQLMGLL